MVEVEAVEAAEVKEDEKGAWVAEEAQVEKVVVAREGSEQEREGTVQKAAALVPGECGSVERTECDAECAVGATEAELSVKVEPGGGGGLLKQAS